tara:strand:+ start:99 stop:695 length:597 start_codon:yes stop_codon:yes gene_type:complete
MRLKSLLIETEITIDEEKKEISINATISWDKDTQPPEISYTEQQISDAVSSHSGSMSGIVTPENPDGGDYQVNFGVEFVPDAESTYDIVLSGPDKPSKVRGQGKSGKEMQLRDGAPLEAIEHEFGHIFGDIDYYGEGTDAAGNRTTTVQEGFENNIMGRIVSGGGTTFDGRNVTRMIQSGTTSWDRHASPGVSVRTFP